VAEGARLESVFTRKGNVGSNPTLSAKILPNALLQPCRKTHPLNQLLPRSWMGAASAGADVGGLYVRGVLGAAPCFTTRSVKACTSRMETRTSSEDPCGQAQPRNSTKDITSPRCARRVARICAG
jgi:hypothetical protein